MTSRWMALLPALLLAACGGLPSLEIRGSQAPEGVDLSGDWELSADTAATLEQLATAARDDAGGPIRFIDELDKPGPRGRDEASVYVFIEAGSKLRISQNPYALFISFDRAVVEEYRFGEHRPISVGEIRGMRASGWERGGYVIETVDQSGNRLLDRYELSADGATLTRRIRIERKDRVHLDLEQRFLRD